MSRVRIVQLLCDKRHCILATAYESPDGLPLPWMMDMVQTAFQSMVKAGADPWCGICKSRDLQSEDAPTRFNTMQEAKPYLEHSERQQLQAAKVHRFFNRHRN